MKLFGISTCLYEGERLQRSHLVEIARHGFEAVELVAKSGHFDCRDRASIESLAEWLDHARLDLPSVHAPIVDSVAALEIARRIPVKFLIVHLPEDPSGMAAVRHNLEDIQHVAEPLGVRVALEVTGNKPSAVEALVDLIEGQLDEMNLGICMDIGHAFLRGDTAEAIEAASGYLMTTHLHDNHRRQDEHLVPFDGAIDWAGTMMALEKIGYDGVLMFEVRNTDSPAAVLARCRHARQRLEDLIGDSSQLSAFSSQ